MRLCLRCDPHDDWPQLAGCLSIVDDLALGLLKRTGFTNAVKGHCWLEGHLREVFALRLIGYPLSSERYKHIQGRA